VVSLNLSRHLYNFKNIIIHLVQNLLTTKQKEASDNNETNPSDRLHSDLPARKWYRINLHPPLDPNLIRSTTETGVQHSQLDIRLGLDHPPHLLMGVPLYLVWEKGLREKKVRISVSVFSVQLALNVLWSVLFFSLRSPLYGMVVIVMLWAAIALTILRFVAISRKVGLILVPYIAWVSFAAVLNYYILILNP